MARLLNEKERMEAQLRQLHEMKRFECGRKTIFNTEYENKHPQNGRD